METEQPSDHQEGPPDIHDYESAVRFIRWCVGRLGLAYHPDARFADYEDADGKQCFASDEAEQLDAIQAKAFSCCDPYEIGFGEFQRLAPGLGAEMTDFQKDFGVPRELQQLIDEGFLEVRGAADLMDTRTP